MLDKYINPLIKPAPLHPKDTLGIVAPAGPYDPKRFNEGIEVIRSLGFEVVIPENLRERNGFLAGSDDHRAAIINNMFRDSDIQGLICARGGYGSMRILDLIDYDLIRDNPKVLIGYSDISALIASIWQRCRLVTFHGPVVTSLGKASRQTKDAFVKAISSSEEIEVKAGSPVIIRGGKCSGIVGGGNLATLCHLLGTSHVPDFSGHILVLEDTDEPPYKVDRMLFQMKTAGFFKDVAGVILGSFENCGDTQGIYAIVERIFQDRDIPILAGFDIGHGPVNITIPMGLKAEMITDSGIFRYSEPATL
jgi:muramoyltetrapeptide carboxypeptidase